MQRFEMKVDYILQMFGFCAPPTFDVHQDTSTNDAQYTSFDDYPKRSHEAFCEPLKLWGTWEPVERKTASDHREQIDAALYVQHGFRGFQVRRHINQEPE